VIHSTKYSTHGIVFPLQQTTISALRERERVKTVMSAQIHTILIMCCVLVYLTPPQYMWRCLIESHNDKRVWQAPAD